MQDAYLECKLRSTGYTTPESSSDGDAYQRKLPSTSKEDYQNLFESINSDENSPDLPSNTDDINIHSDEQGEIIFVNGEELLAMNMQGENNSMYITDNCIDSELDPLRTFYMYSSNTQDNSQIVSEVLGEIPTTTNEYMNQNTENVNKSDLAEESVLNELKNLAKVTKLLMDEQAGIKHSLNTLNENMFKVMAQNDVIMNMLSEFCRSRPVHLQANFKAPSNIDSKYILDELEEKLIDADYKEQLVWNN